MKISTIEIPDGGNLTTNGSTETTETTPLEGYGTAGVISSPPGTLSFVVNFHGPKRSVRSLELVELLDSVHHAPHAVTIGVPGLDGYYVADSQTRSIRLSQGTSDRDDDEEVDLTLLEAGTRATHLRAIETTPADADNDFGDGSDQTAYIGVDARASRVRWFDAETQATETPTLVETRAAERGDVDIYDAASSSFAEPILVYDLPYADEGDVDLRVWDTQNGSSDEWQQVFSPVHHHTSESIVDTGLLRLRFDDSTASLIAETWADVTATWEPRSLGPLHNPLDDLTNITTGTNASATTVSSPSQDGTAVQATTDAATTQGNRTVTWTPSSAIDLSASGDIAFWIEADTTAGTHALTLTDSAAATETVSYKSQLSANTFDRVELASSNWSTVDLTAITDATWDFAGDGTGISKTITIDRLAGPSDWQLADADVTRIGLGRVAFQFDFQNAADGSTYALDGRLARGMDAVQWTVPTGESALPPSGLKDYLDPIATESVQTPSEEAGLRERAEVRQ